MKIFLVVQLLFVVPPQLLLAQVNTQDAIPIVSPSEQPHVDGTDKAESHAADIVYAIHPWLRDCGLVLVAELGGDVAIEKLQELLARGDEALIRDRLLAPRSSKLESVDVSNAWATTTEIPLRLRWSDNLRGSYLGPVGPFSLSLRIAIDREGKVQLGTWGNVQQEHLAVLSQYGGIENYRDFDGNVLSLVPNHIPHNAHLDTDQKQTLLAEWLEDVVRYLRNNDLIVGGPENGQQLYQCPMRLFNLFPQPVSVLHARIHHQQFDYSWYPEELRVVDRAMNDRWSPIASRTDQDAIVKLAFDLDHEGNNVLSALYLYAGTDNRNESRFAAYGISSGQSIVSQQGTTSHAFLDAERGVVAGGNRDSCGSMVLLYDQAPSRIELEAATRWSVVQPFCRYVKLGEITTGNWVTEPADPAGRVIKPALWVIQPAKQVGDGYLASKQESTDRPTTSHGPDSARTDSREIEQSENQQTILEGSRLFENAATATFGTEGTTAKLESLLGQFDLSSVESLVGVFRRSLQLTMYSPTRYPDGHPDLAMCDVMLAFCRLFQGDIAGSQKRLDEVRQMVQRLRKAGSQSQTLAEVEVAVEYCAGLAHLMYGEHAHALDAFEQMLPKLSAVYPRELYPRGHITIVFAHQMAALCQIYAEQYDDAELHLAAAAKMLEKLLARERGLLGDLLQAVNMQYSGILYHRKDELDKAEASFEEALSLFGKMRQSSIAGLVQTSEAALLLFYGRMLMDADRFGDATQRLMEAEKLFGTNAGFSGLRVGITLARRMHGESLAKSGNWSEAVSVLDHALHDEREILADVLAGASEAESLNYLRRNRESLDTLLSCWLHTSEPLERIYDHIRNYQSLTFRTLALRQQLLQADASTETRQLYARYLNTRRDLAEQALLGTGDDLFSILQQRSRLQSLVTKKEQLERQLSDALPEFRRRLADDASSLADLAQTLPKHATLLDYVRYLDSSMNHSEMRYVAFVVAPDASIQCIRLGPAEVIDQRVRQWRTEIAQGTTSDTGDVLRTQIWDPVAAAFPGNTDTVYIQPDGPLHAIPFAAIPISDGSSVLLEQYALAFLPSGTLLSPQYAGKEVAAAAGSDVLLVVVDVDYGTAAVASSGEGASLAGNHSGSLHWPSLPSTAQELAPFEAHVKGRQDSKLVALTGKEADCDEVLQQLPQATIAHFATHGYFVPEPLRPDVRQTGGVDLGGRQLFGMERNTSTSRNPLLLSGLVLAGANPKKDTNTGMLSAEMIAGLPLNQLDLAVLSACETSLGDVAPGEGVFGLQRSFHLAGTKNVIASLWKVDDDATAALMHVFYHNLWHNQQSPMEAIRNAQLTIYRHPELTEALACGDGTVLEDKLRGLDFSKQRRLPGGGNGVENANRSPTRKWAAFVLSGRGSYEHDR